ncbi:MAG: hypothetical protein HZB39_06045 [Planctomycetes bacterium]|nr:hypothetical protein [Planctomycetota bacterium]
MIGGSRPQDDLQSRLARLEQSLLRWRRSASCIAALALGLTLLAWSSVADGLDARRFRLLDDAGRVRAALDFDARDEPRFALVDAAGKPRLQLRLQGAEAFVDLLDERGRHRLGLAIDTAGLPQVLLLDEEQRPRYQLAMNEKGAPGMMFLAGDSTICAGQGIDTNGEPWRIDRPLRAEPKQGEAGASEKDRGR